MRENYKRLSLRLSQMEYEKLSALSHDSGLKMEPLLRQMIKGTELRQRPDENYQRLLQQLGGIGNNINQMTRIANAKGTVSKAEIAEIHQLMQDVRQLMQQL